MKIFRLIPALLLLGICSAATVKKGRTDEFPSLVAVQSPPWLKDGDVYRSLQQTDDDDDPACQSCSFSSGNTLFIGGCPLGTKDVENAWCDKSSIASFCCAQSQGDCCEPNPGVIAGMTIGAVAFVAVMVLACCACCSCCKYHDKLCCSKNKNKTAAPKNVPAAAAHTQVTTTTTNTAAKFNEYADEEA